MTGSAGQRGYILVALLAAIAIMLIAMTVAVPGWRYVMKNDREEELIFRGCDIAAAIQRYRAKKGVQPTTIEALVKEKFLRKAYKDPMTPHGRWRMLQPGLPIPPVRTPPVGPSPSPSPSVSASPGPGSTGAGTSIGPFDGVASYSTEKSLRLFVGQDRYDRWLFRAGQPCWVGKPPGPTLGDQRRPSPSPNASPTDRK